MTYALAAAELSHEQYVEAFTRKYTKTHYDVQRCGNNRTPPPPAANDNEPNKPPKGSSHEWPARDRLLANELMVGDTATEAAMLNARALIELRDFRELLDAVAPPTAWLASEGHEAFDSGEPYGNGYGADVKRDYGPSEEKLKVLWEAGAEPSAEGEPWNHGPVKLMDAKSPLGSEIKKLWQVGDLRFNADGRITHFRTNGRWLKLLDRTRGPKGKRAKKDVKPDLEDIKLYTGAAIPRDPKTGEAQVDFLAGKAAQADLDPRRRSEDPERPAPSKSDPIVFNPAGNQVTARERAYAVEALERRRDLLGEDLYAAMCGAALGENFDHIGGKPGDKSGRASAVGTFAVRTALKMLIEAKYT